ncbi:MAG: DUF2155 domain-containing protein [Rickettsiales bacterium]|nr:DUF2155 domain-containing protein [Rickettsiales bacterium]
MKKNNFTFFLTLFFTLIFIFEKSPNIAAQESKTAEENIALENNSVIDLDLSRFNNVAVIQVLNKITAKSSLLEIKISNSIKFGKLIITAHKCWQSSLDQKPESKILLEIFDIDDENSDKNNAKKPIFFGWMFSSSPSISSLEHPIYDVTAISCKNK